MKREPAFLLLLTGIFLILGFSFTSIPHDLDAIYHSRSPAAIDSFFSTWRKRSLSYQESNNEMPGKTETRIDLLISSVLNKAGAGQVTPSPRFHIVPDSVDIIFYRKTWTEYPQTLCRFPSPIFSAWKDSACLFLFHDYDSSVVAFLDTDPAMNETFRGNDSAAPPRMQFLATFFPVYMDQSPATYNSTFQLDRWRKKIGYNSGIAWVIETPPFIENIYMKKNLCEAYVFLNRFSLSKCFYCTYKNGGWIVKES